MGSFVQYYASEIERYSGLDNYVVSKSIEKKPLLDRVKKYATEKKIIEAGCGSATNSISLAQEGFFVTCVDKDKEMLDFAKTNANNYKSKPLFLKLDISRLSELKNSFNVAFSHGVLEHYPDKEIIWLINAQLAVAKMVVISVPSNFFKQSEAINGDERFLDKKYWINLISKTDGQLIEAFDYFYDSSNFKIIFLKLISKLTFNKLPRKKPYIGFVVRRK